MRFAHFGRQADALQDGRDAPLDLAAREGALRGERQRHDVIDAAARIERGERVLEHRLDQPRARLAVEIEQALSVDQRGAGGRREQPEDQPRERRLPAAGLAHDPEHAAGRHAERHIVDRDHVPLRRQQPERTRNSRRRLTTSIAALMRAAARRMSRGISRQR